MAVPVCLSADLCGCRIGLGYRTLYVLVAVAFVDRLVAEIKTDPKNFTAIFVVSGDVTLSTEDQQLSAQKESLVFLHPDMTVSCVCTGKTKKAELVVINVA